MSALYKLVVRSKVGAKLQETMDFLELAYTKRVNQPGLLKFRLRGNHKLISDLEEDCQVEVWRTNPTLGLDWYADFYGLFSAPAYETNDTTTFTATVPGQMTLLSRRITAYPAAMSDRTTFTDTAAETVLKNLVRYNATGSATQDAGRDRDGYFDSFTIDVADDLGQGSVISWGGSRKNLLTELQKIADVAAGDFDLVKTGPATWEFRFYPGRLGTDKSDSVVFSLSRGNMAKPKVAVVAKTASVAVVGGQGKEEAREVVIVGSGDGPEVFVDGRNDESSALTTRGNLALADGAQKIKFTFDVIQTQRAYYGLHYGLGDLVKAEHMGISVLNGVRGVTVSVKGGKEDIAVETE